jgi:hypothetical protein
MTYRIELIPKTSTLNDIIGPWVDSGREDNRIDGQFIFEDVDSFRFADGTLIIHRGMTDYFYNLADFYRVKAIKVETPETDDWVGGVK